MKKSFKLQLQILSCLWVRCTPPEERPHFLLYTTHSYWHSVNSTWNKGLSNRENWFRIRPEQAGGNKHGCELQANLAHYLPLHTSPYSPFTYLPWSPLQKATSAALISIYYPLHLVNILHVALLLHSSFFPHMLLINPIYWLILLLRRCLSSRINTLVLANWYCVNWLCFSVQPYFNKPLTVPQNALLCVWICQQSTFLVAQKRFVFSNPFLKPNFNTWVFSYFIPSPPHCSL